jgi:hypothetical protein
VIFSHLAAFSDKTKRVFGNFIQNPQKPFRARPALAAEAADTGLVFLFKPKQQGE